MSAADENNRMRVSMHSLLPLLLAPLLFYACACCTSPPQEEQVQAQQEEAPEPAVPPVEPKAEEFVVSEEVYTKTLNEPAIRPT
jgi:hypothetical protein